MLLFDSVDPIYSMHWLRYFTRMPEAGMRNGPTNLRRDGSVGCCWGVMGLYAVVCMSGLWE